jgi:hypothetical protein
MTVGYDNMTGSDFRAYWLGCVIFHYEHGGKVRPYTIEDTDCCEEVDYHGVEDLTVYLRAVDGAPEEPDRTVTVGTLIHEPTWIIHRFPLGYCCANGKLLHVSMEPNDRRMRKGFNTETLHFQGILAGVDDHAPRAITNRLVNTGTPPVIVADVLCAVGDVLAHGLCNAMRANIGPARAEAEVHTKLTSFLADPEMVDSVFVPSFTTAIVRHRSNPAWSYMLVNRELVGTLVYDAETTRISMTGAVRHHTDRAARKLARLGIESVAKQLGVSSFEWK